MILWKSNVNITVQLVLLQYREIKTVKPVILCKLNFLFHENSRKHKKVAGTNFFFHLRQEISLGNS